jgi:matrix metalloproteinase-14 (membrane-inserted)
MQTYGYLKEPTSESEGLAADFLYAEEAVVSGIRNIQRFGGVEVTGVLDEETVKLLSAPRCGVKDVLNSRERQKRYIIGSKNWGKRQITYL